MKILSSELSMEATKGHTDVTRLALSQTRQNPNNLTQFNLNLPRNFSGTAFSYQAGASSTSTIENSTENGEKLCTVESQHTLAKELVQTLTGRSASVTTDSQHSPSTELITGNRRPVTRFYRVGNQPFQINLGVNATTIETQSLKVNSSGSVRTEDGREINFTLDLFMESREVSQTITGFSGLGGVLVDPIVLNFTAGLDMLEDDFSFSFDLDCDGEEENICGLKSGSGFLALDKNSDAIINDGSELFGPLTGSGYNELAVYDVDHNNWIDENDPIFEQLLVWMGSGSGNGELVSLKEAGVGAIALAHVSGGKFNLKNEYGQVMATVDSSGLFLTEDGAVHSMQELDLLVQDENEPGQSDDTEGAFNQMDFIRVLKEKIRQHRRDMLAALHRKEHDELTAAERESWLQKRFWQWNEYKSDEPELS